MWGKEKIDALERQVEVYGETSDLRNQLIALSLRYNIRCRYTAYVADYKTEYTSVEQDLESLTHMPKSMILNNYPNPFNPSTKFTIFIAPGDEGEIKFIKVYNALGQLVAILDISHLNAGQHTIRFDAVDLTGRPLPAGQYFVRLKVGESISTWRMTLVR